VRTFAPARTVQAAARFVDRVGFALLMPHRGLPIPTLWEAIRGRPGGHPFRTWTEDSDRMWEFKDELPKRRLAFYGSLWLGHPGFVSLELLPCLMKLWGCPPGEDGFRTAYREGRLSFDANRIGEALLRSRGLNTYRLRLKTGLQPNTFKRALVELQRKLIVAKCGTDSTDTTWAAEVVDLSARVFLRAHSDVRGISFLEAREESLAAFARHAPALPPRQVARLLRVGPNR
jgi:hypothetical protein